MARIFYKVLCVFFMDVIMSKNKGVFSRKCNINTATCAMKNVPIVVRCRQYCYSY